MPSNLFEPTDLHDREKMVSKWLLNSGILNRTYWAFHHNYNPLRRTYGPLYTEVTGYGISLLVDCLSWSKDFAFLKDYARRLAEFIHSSKITLGNGESLFRFGYYPSTRSWDSKAYSFDTAMCISGILELSRLVEKSKLAKDAVECGNWLIRTMQNKDGSFKTCMDAGSKKYVNIPSWFGDRGCLHGKIAMSLYRLYEHTSDHMFMDSFSKSLKWLLSMQKPSGGILARQGESYLFTHSHCYASEAMAFAYWKTEEEAYLIGLRKSVEWLIQHQNKDGSYNQSYGLHVPAPWKRVDATAQACRLFLLMYMIEHNENYILAAEKTARFLLASQLMNSGNIGVHGGLCSKLLFFLKWPELNSWTNLFAIHALHMLDRLDEYHLARAIRELF